MLRPFVFALLLCAGCAHEHSHEKVDSKPYIVELRDDVDVDAFVDEHYIEPATPLPIIHGFAAELRPATLVALEADARVERLTADGETNALANHRH